MYQELIVVGDVDIQSGLYVRGLVILLTWTTATNSNVDAIFATLLRENIGKNVLDSLNSSI